MTKEESYINSILSAPTGADRIETLLSINKSLFFIETYKIKSAVNTPKYNTVIWWVKFRTNKNPRQQVITQKYSFTREASIEVHKKSIDVLQITIDRNKKFEKEMETFNYFTK